MERKRSTALVTGASRGIGREFARLLAANGHGLVLVGRDAAALDEFARQLSREYGTTIRCEAIDLSVPGAPSKQPRAPPVRLSTDTFRKQIRSASLARASTG